MTVSERLRWFVRARVRKDGPLYTWGAAARLAAALGRPSSWVSEYTDPTPTRHADLDTALAICRFFGVSVMDFEKTPEPSVVAPTTPTLTRHERRALTLLQRMNEKGQRLAVTLLAGYVGEFPKRGWQESPSRTHERPSGKVRKARGTQ